MANTKTWPDPDTQVAQQGRADVHGVYLLDPVTQKAVTPATGSGGGGGGGAVTVADGADVTQGTSTDANTVASIMGRLTKIRDLLNATLTVGGTITEANSATIATNTTGIATQATLAQVKSDLDTLVTNTADLLADGDNLATIATNTTGAATAANQSTGNTSLASIKTDLDEIALDTDNLANIPAKGTAVMTGSTPVTIATDDTQMTAIKNSVAAIPAKGAAATSGSTPVNIASDQVVPMKLSTVAVYSLASTQSTGSTQNSGDLTVGAYREISLDINTTAQSGTSPTVQFFYERKAADGIYYVLWQSAVLTVAANTLSTSIGSGMAFNQSLGVTGRLRWVVGGSATPTFTFSANIQGK